MEVSLPGSILDYPPKPDENAVIRFPVKLWKITNNCLSGAIGWNDNGTTIKICRKKFEKEFLHNTANPFKTKNFNSFVRQLNLYGFNKFIQIRRYPWQLNDDSVVEYCHQNFKRGRPELLSKLERKVNKSNDKENFLKSSLFLDASDGDTKAKKPRCHHRRKDMDMALIQNMYTDQTCSEVCPPTFPQSPVHSNYTECDVQVISPSKMSQQMAGLISCLADLEQFSPSQQIVCQQMACENLQEGTAIESIPDYTYLSSQPDPCQVESDVFIGDTLQPPADEVNNGFDVEAPGYTAENDSLVLDMTDLQPPQQHQTTTLDTIDPDCIANFSWDQIQECNDLTSPPALAIHQPIALADFGLLSKDNCSSTDTGLFDSVDSRLSPVPNGLQINIPVPIHSNSSETVGSTANGILTQAYYDPEAGAVTLFLPEGMAENKQSNDGYIFIPIMSNKQ